VLLLSFFYNFSKDFVVLNIMCFYIWITGVLSEGTQTSFVFARYFYSLCNPVILVFHTCVVNWKSSLENV
jgi:hypothetical protein